MFTVATASLKRFGAGLNNVLHSDKMIRSNCSGRLVDVLDMKQGACHICFSRQVQLERLFWCEES